MSDVEELREAVDALEAAYVSVNLQLRKDMPDVKALEVTDTNGRYILLDSLTTLVHARAILVDVGNR